MNNILVAIYNKNTYEELLKEKDINIINKKILYREGILEILENDFEINYIIINEKIPGEIELNNLIYRIREINKNIKIILVIEKNKKDIIKNKNNLIMLEEENIIKILNIIENKKEENIEEQKYVNKKQLEIKTNKSIFLIEGNSGSGKSIVSTILSYQFSKINKKILLIDFDIEKGNIHTIFQVKKEENNIQKINKNLYFVNTNQEEIIKGLFKQDYDIFIFDNCKNYFNLNFKRIYLLESNLVEIEKAKNNIKSYFQKNDYFLINKYNKNSIDEKILENIFGTKNILKLKYKSIYNSLINNFNINKNNLSLNKEYKNIIKKII